MLGSGGGLTSTQIEKAKFEMTNNIHSLLGSANSLYSDLLLLISVSFGNKEQIKNTVNKFGFDWLVQFQHCVFITNSVLEQFVEMCVWEEFMDLLDFLRIVDKIWVQQQENMGFLGEIFHRFAWPEDSGIRNNLPQIAPVLERCVSILSSVIDTGRLQETDFHTLGVDGNQQEV